MPDHDSSACVWPEPERRRLRREWQALTAAEEQRRRAAARARASFIAALYSSHAESGQVTVRRIADLLGVSRTTVGQLLVESRTTAAAD